MEFVLLELVVVSKSRVSKVVMVVMLPIGMQLECIRYEDRLFYPPWSAKVRETECRAP